MMDPVWIMFLGGPLLAVLIYFAGVERGKRAEKRRSADRADRTTADAERRQEDLVAAKVEAYLASVRSLHASGIHALATLGLYELDSDERIRGAIERMKLGSGKDPLGRKTPSLLEGVDLRRFFRHLAENSIDLHKTSVSDALASMED